MLATMKMVYECCIYNLNFRDSGLVYGASAIGVFMLLFSISIFNDRRSLKIENENNSMNNLITEVSYIGS